MKTIEVIHITPEIAKEFLGKNIQNRAIKQAHLSNLISDMINDRWAYTGDPIKFDTEGNLVDGQHRLSAIVKSGKSYDFLVVRGFTSYEVEHFDKGVARNAADVLAFQGVRQPINIAALAKKIIIWKRGKIVRSNPVSQTEILEFCKKTDLREYLVFNKQKYRTPFFKTSELNFLYWLFSNIDKDDCIEFLDRLHTGINLEENSPIYLLRQRLEKNILSKSNLPEAYKLALVIKAWNYFRRREPLKALKWAEGEQFPMPI